METRSGSVTDIPQNIPLLCSAEQTNKLTGLEQLEERTS